MGKGSRSGNVKQPTGSTGSYPASQVQVLSDDSKFLFKVGQMSYRRGSSPRQFLRDVLSGTEAQIAAVESQSQNNTYDYSVYDIAAYHGPLEAAVMAWLAAHPPVGHK